MVLREGCVRIHDSLELEAVLEMLGRDATSLKVCTRAHRYFPYTGHLLEFERRKLVWGPTVPAGSVLGLDLGGIPPAP